MLVGSIVNALAILAGAAAGLLLKQAAGRLSSVLPDSAALGARLQNIITQGLALCVIYLGVSGSLKGQNSLITILSMVIGALVGELLDLDGAMYRLGDWVQKKMARLAPAGGEASISEGFVTASLLFCVGAMAIVGSLENGLTGNYDTLKAKSVLDGISSIVFSSSLGIGVMFSAVAIFLYQGSISLLAGVLSPLIGSAAVQNEMTCVGSLLIAALSLNMLGVTKIKVMNLVPACLMPILLCHIL